MNIIIDARCLSQPLTGVGYSVSQILKQFIEHHNEHEYTLYGSTLPYPFRRLSKYYFKMALSLANKKADLFWGTGFRGIFSKRFKTVISIYDMAHIYYPDFAEAEFYKFLSRKLKSHAQKAEMILTISDSTRRDVVNYLDIPEDKVRVTYLGVDPQYRPVGDSSVVQAIREKYGLPERYILFVGTLQPRKNVEGLLGAFRMLEDEYKVPHKLVLVGCKGWKYDGIFSRIERDGLSDKVVFPGYVDYQDLPVLYSAADLFVLPSYYEGFGLPILEAMACGTPVVTSNVSSMPEVAGDAAVLVDPKRTEDIAGGIYRVLNDPALAGTLRERGMIRAKEFTWEKCADETMQVFEEVVGERR